MELLVGIIIFFLIFTVVVWRRKSEVVRQRSSSQAIIYSAQRIVDVINESLKIANDSMNADTKISRLDLAKAQLAELKKLSREHSFIKITDIQKVEQSICGLEQEFLLSHYREAADGNMRGQDLEKEGNIDKAILEYERLLNEGVDTPFTYRRLAIIYSKLKKPDEEVRVLQAAIRNIPVQNSGHYQWFAERLAKKTKAQ